MSVVCCKRSQLPEEYNHLEDWLSDVCNNLYIGRAGRIFIGSKKDGSRRIFHYPGSVWKNPFRVKEHGLEKSLKLYEEYIRKRIEEDPVTFNIDTLKGKRLGCWCKPNDCHGDILMNLLKEK